MAALGANRRALISPILTEVGLLAVFSAVFALLGTYGALRLIAVLKPSDIHSPERLALNFHAFIFTTCASVLTLLLFGFLPVRMIDPKKIIQALKITIGDSKSAAYTRPLLMTLQIAAALSLTLIAVLLLRSFQRLLDLDQGFDTRGVLTAHLALPLPQYSDPQSRARFCRGLIDNIKTIPEVESAALIDYLPLRAIRIIPFEIEGRAIPERNAAPFSDFANVTPEFFKSMRIGLRQGRLFTYQDAEANPANVVIINEALARQFWPNQDPVGSHIRRLTPNGPPGPWQTVIGVVADFHQVNTETPARPELLWPTKDLSEMTVVLRANGTKPLSLSSPLQQAVWNADHDQPLSDIESLDQIVDDYNSQRRFNVLTVGAFAAFSLLITLVGIYGLTASLITSHIRDIGIRFALGASRTQVCLSLLRPSLIPVLTGIALGLLFSFLAKRLIAAILFQTSPLDPLTYIATPTVLVLILILTSLTATRRAARIDPASVLRQE
jgi:predicted permease